MGKIPPGCSLSLGRKWFAHLVPLTLVAMLSLAAAPARGQTVTATVAVGQSPSAMAVNPVTNKIYVANRSDNTVTVIDGASNTVSATVPVGTSPVAVAVSPTTNKIYVVNQGDTLNPSTVTVIDGTTNNTTPLAVGVNPSAVAAGLGFDGFDFLSVVYVVNSGSDNRTATDDAP